MSKGLFEDSCVCNRENMRTVDEHYSPEYFLFMSKTEKRSSDSQQIRFFVTSTGLQMYKQILKRTQKWLKLDFYTFSAFHPTHMFIS